MLPNEIMLQLFLIKIYTSANSCQGRILLLKKWNLKMANSAVQHSSNYVYAPATHVSLPHCDLMWQVQLVFVSEVYYLDYSGCREESS